jgi:hypothetical protein
MLATKVSFFYSGNMASKGSLSLESLVRQSNIAYAAIAAIDLEPGMVLRFGGKLRIVISVSYENTADGPVSIVERATGIERFPCDS